MLLVSFCLNKQISDTVLDAAFIIQKCINHARHYSARQNLLQAEIRVYYYAFAISRPQIKEKHSQVGKLTPQMPVQSALSSAFMVKNESKKFGFGLGQDLTIIGVKT
jgi:hypothetical protein